MAAGPVSRILSAGLLRRDGHSSGPRITARLKRPTRRLWRTEPARAQGRSLRLPPYLVLLRVGFALPAALLRQRCALTAPFHPYPDVATGAVCFLWHFPSTGLEPGLPDVIRHTALRSSDFPPVFRRATVRSGCQHIHYSGRRASGLGVIITAATDFTDSHGSNLLEYLSKSVQIREIRGQIFSQTSVRQILLQLLNLPESIRHTLIHRRQRRQLLVGLGLVPEGYAGVIILAVVGMAMFDGGSQ